MIDLVMPGFEDEDRYYDEEEEETTPSTPLVLTVEMVCRYCGAPIDLRRVSEETAQQYHGWNREPAELTDDEVRSLGFNPSSTRFHTEYSCCSDCTGREF